MTGPGGQPPQTFRGEVGRFFDGVRSLVGPFFQGVLEATRVPAVVRWGGRHVDSFLTSADGRLGALGNGATARLRQFNDRIGQVRGAMEEQTKNFRDRGWEGVLTRSQGGRRLVEGIGDFVGGFGAVGGALRRRTASVVAPVFRPVQAAGRFVSQGAEWVGDRLSQGAQWVGDHLSQGAEWVGDHLGQGVGLVGDVGTLLGRGLHGLAAWIEPGGAQRGTSNDVPTRTPPQPSFGERTGGLPPGWTPGGGVPDERPAPRSSASRGDRPARVDEYESESSRSPSPSREERREAWRAQRTAQRNGNGQGRTSNEGPANDSQAM